MKSRNSKRSRVRIAILALAMIGLANCGGDDASTPPVPTNPLAGAALAVDTITGLGRVDIEGVTVTKAVEDLAVVIGAEGIDDITLPTEIDEDGAFFYAPLHPMVPNEGGPVTVHVTSGTHRSEPLALELGALPPAPGAFVRVVETLRAHIEQRAQWHGTNFDELKATSFDAVATDLLGLKMAQSFVDNGTDTDFESLSGPGGGQISEDERELIDRLFGYAPLDALLQAQIDAFADETAGKAPFLSTGVTHDKGAKCFDPGIEIGSAQALSDAMLNSALADIAINPDGAPGRTLEALGVVLSAGGVIPGYSTGFTIAGAGLAAWQASNALLGNVLPNHFVKLEFDFDKPEFFEDHEGYGTWSNVMATAGSNAWSADADITNVVISALATKISLTQQLKIQEAEFLRDAAITGINMGLGEFLDQQPGGVVEICAKQWEVDITDLPWSTGDALDNNFSVDPAWRRVEMLEVGPDVLQVAAQPSQFGGREISKDLPIETKPIILDLTPDDITVTEPGETITITSDIHNAETTTMSWTANEGAWNDGLGGDTNGPATRTLATPTDPDAYPFNIFVESTSTGGLRADGDPPRTDDATVRLGLAGVIVTPEHECVTNDQTVQFEATVVGVDNPEVVWAIEEGWGSINETSGLYTAPPIGTTDDVIVATVVDHEELKGRASVKVGSCECRWSIDVGGAAVYHKTGSEGYYTAVGFESDVIIQWMFLLPGGDGEVAAFSANLWGDADNPAPAPGDTGTWRINASFNNGSETWGVSQEDEGAQMIVNITEFDGTHMVATMTGQCVQRNDPDDRDRITSSVHVAVDFKLGFWEIGGRFPCID